MTFPRLLLFATFFMTSVHNALSACLCRTACEWTCVYGRSLDSQFLSDAHSKQFFPNNPW